MNLGAPYLDTHASYSLENVIGSVVPDSARIEGGKGICRILLSRAAGDADTVQKIKDGVIRNNSVGYWIHKVVKTEGDDGTVARWEVVDWEPLEISAVPIPADPGSQVRSERQQQEGQGPALRSCTIVTTTRAPARVPKKGRQESRMTKTARTVPGKRAAASSQRAPADRTKTPAELEAERVAKGRGAKRDDDKSKDDEDEDADADEKRDDDDADGENDGGGDTDGKDDDGDGERDADTEEDDEDGDGKKDDERAATGDKRNALTPAQVRKAAEAAVRADRRRGSEIREIAAQFGFPKLGERHANGETSVRAFKDLVLERLAKRQEKRGNTTFAATDDADVTRGSARGAERGPGKQQREMAEGEAHWGRVAGKKPKAA